MPARKNRPDKRRAQPSVRPAVVEIGTSEEAEELAIQLLDSTRQRPFVVISTSSAADKPYIDPAMVAQALGEVADVAVLTSRNAAWALSRLLPSLTQVYGGAGRVYPPGIAWATNHWLSAPRFAYGPEEGPRAAQQLIDDAMRRATHHGVVHEETSATRAAGGVVSGLFPPARAVVRIDDGTLATVRQEWTVPHIAIDRVLALGQRVHGTLDDTTGRLDIAASLRPAAETLAPYDVGSVVLVVVTEIAQTAATVRLHPDVSATIARDQITSNELDELHDLFSVGEVLHARIAHRDGLSIEVRLDDIDDDDEALPAPALIPGGPPWLSLDPATILVPDSVDDLPATAPDDLAPHGRRSETERPDNEHTTAGYPETEPPEVDRPASERPVVGRPDSERPVVGRPDGEQAVVGRPGGEQSQADRPDNERSVVGPTTPGTPGAGRSDVGQVALAALTLSLNEARATIRDLTTRLHRAEEERDALRIERAVLRAEAARDVDTIRRLEQAAADDRTRRRNAAVRGNQAFKAQRAAAHADAEGGTDDLDAFTDPEDQFRYEVYRSWVRRIPKSDKPGRPLGEYTVGPRFLASISAAGIERSKVVDVVVEVLTGLATELDSRELRQLRQGASGAAPPVVRADGALCWRVSLQRSTPSARRLHFWRTPTRVELSRVVLHDDMEP